MKPFFKNPVLLFVLSAVALCGFFYARELSALGEEPDEPSWNREGYYEISSAGELACMATWVNGGKSVDQRYVLTENIDLGGLEWTPIGTPENGKMFAGVFDGNGKIISNLSIKNFKPSYGGKKFAGLFGYVKHGDSRGAILRNVSIISADIEIDHAGKIDALAVGALVGEAYNTVVENCSAQGVKLTLSSSTGSLFVGGLLGSMTAYNTAHSWIDECFASSVISVNSSGATRTGGLAGYVNFTVLEECIAQAEIDIAMPDGSSEKFMTGGLVGNMTKSEAANSASCGRIGVKGLNDRIYLGGLIGVMDLGGTNRLSTCLSRTVVSTQRGAIGGLLGMTDANKHEVISCDWLLFGDALDMGIGIDGTTVKIVQPVHAKSIDMTTLADRDHFKERGWDFDSVWHYSPLDGRSAPHPAFAFTDATAETLAPSLLAILPRSADMSDGSLVRAKYFSAHFSPETLTFDGEERLETAGIHFVSHTAPSGDFVVSADDYVTEANRDVEISALLQGYPQTVKFRLTVRGDIEITTASLSAADAGTPYTASIDVINADGLPTFSSVGAMPPGLDIAASTGVISGTPTSADEFDLTVEASDSRHTARKNFSLTVSPVKEKPGEPPTGEDDDEEEEPPTDEDDEEEEEEEEKPPIDEDDDKEEETPPTDEDDDEGDKEQTPVVEPLTEILSSLNAELSGANVETLSDAPAGLTAISAVASGDCAFSIGEKSSLPGRYTALANSFSISVPLGDLTDGDTLVLSYEVELAQLDAFADWASLSVSERADRLDDAGVALIYEFAHLEGEARFAHLIGGQSATNWRDAVATGAARMTRDGIAVKYAVTDGTGAPYIDGSFIVIPDGDANSTIEDPIWLATLTDATPPTENADAGRSGIGCSGAGIIPALFLAGAFFTFCARRRGV